MRAARQRHRRGTCHQRCRRQRSSRGVSSPPPRHYKAVAPEVPSEREIVLETDPRRFPFALLRPSSAHRRISAGRLSAGGCEDVGRRAIMATQTLNREQVLEELKFLTMVEHALIVEFLSLYCALGHDLPEGDGGATTQPGRDARDQGFLNAQAAMFRYKALQLVLVEAGGSPELGRAVSVSNRSGAYIALAAPTAEQFQRFLERAEDIASVIEERYADLRPAVTSAPVFEGPLLEHVRAIV